MLGLTDLLIDSFIFVAEFVYSSLHLLLLMDEII